MKPAFQHTCCFSTANGLSRSKSLRKDLAHPISTQGREIILQCFENPHSEFGNKVRYFALPMCYKKLNIICAYDSLESLWFQCQLERGGKLVFDFEKVCKYSLALLCVWARNVITIKDTLLLPFSLQCST